MHESLSYCGIICNECEAFKATQSADKKELENIAKKWSNEQLNLKAGDIECEGCKSSKKLFSWCRECPIRICCIDQSLENCAFCKEYPCEKLEPSFKHDPNNKKRLDEIKNTQ